VRRSPARVPVEGLIDYDAFCGGARTADARGPASEITVEEFAARRASGITLIDVREPHEHELGHLDGDRLVPLATLLANPQLAGEGPVVVYCASGVRSAKAAAALVRAGTPAVSLRGGFIAWRMANPAER
jgi:sulfur-carrier protein adenylyltransferase/sulfurtransferase